MTPNKLKLVLCIWKDAWVDGTDPVSQNDAHLKHRASIHETIGWLLFQNEDGISIANEYCPEDETYRGRTYIPNGMLVSTTPFNLTKPRQPRVKKPNIN